MSDRPYHMPGVMPEKVSLKQEIEEIKTDLKLKVEEENLRAKERRTQGVINSLTSLEEDIRDTAKSGRDYFGFTLSSDNVEKKFLRSPKVINDGILVWNKFVDLGFEPKLKQVSWNTYHIYIEL